jgi:hypothetical protein
MTLVVILAAARRLRFEERALMQALRLGVRV